MFLLIYRDDNTDKILDLMFVWVDEGIELKVDLPVDFKGLEDCPSLKKEQISLARNREMAPAKVWKDVSGT
ncbi:hypothetical protein V6N12_055347 [Hibiscus sabdariffa]|uniref:Uncharacterized protein n=1 Tax=Hibiscus sabdariffa TaxID=183260 RepID=A0ABR2AQ93_9ROSI